MRWICSVNHNDISVLYQTLSLFFALISTSLSGLIRLELMSPGTSVLTNHHYNTVVTSHSIVIVFFFIMPFLISSFSNWLIPLFVTTPDISFPRINNFSFWIIMPASIFLVQSMNSSGTSSSWTIYPPLSTSENCIDIVIFSLHCASVSSILSSANFIVTIILNSPNSTQIYNAALFLWCMLVTSFMLLTTLPVLASAITIILFDRHFSTSFFEYGSSSDALLFQHLFWFFSHPEVYVLILPSFSLLSHVIEFNIDSARIWGYYGIIWSIIGIGFLSFVVWAHHMYSASIDTDSNMYFSAATIMISIPTSVNVFTWLANINSNNLYVTLPLVWAVLFIWFFTLSSCTSIVCSSATIDLDLHDTYYVVAHFHYVLSISATSAVVISSVHYWPVFSSLYVLETSLIVSTVVFSLSVNSVFFPIHKLSIESMPRRYIHYSPLMVSTNRLISWSLLVTISSAIIILWSLNSNLSNLVSTISYVLPVDQIFSLPTNIHSWEESPYSSTL